jgi:glucose-6-phosphate dehydrogenase assembly protein OpcA
MFVDGIEIKDNEQRVRIFCGREFSVSLLRCDSEETVRNHTYAQGPIVTWDKWHVPSWLRAMIIRECRSLIVQSPETDYEIEMSEGVCLNATGAVLCREHDEYYSDDEIDMAQERAFVQAGLMGAW